jgi:glyoxylase-like metal-dependent hydrolase (beta-lactamase superfamily II)
VGKIDSEPLTLIDTGPATVQTLQALEGELAVVGRRIEDLELIVITHHHRDHFGLAAALARRANAKVAGPSVAREYFKDHDVHARLDEDSRLAALRRHGVPDDALNAHLEG